MEEVCPNCGEKCFDGVACGCCFWEEGDPYFKVNFHRNERNKVRKNRKPEYEKRPRFQSDGD